MVIFEAYFKELLTDELKSLRLCRLNRLIVISRMFSNSEQSMVFPMNVSIVHLNMFTTNLHEIRSTTSCMHHCCACTFEQLHLLRTFDDRRMAAVALTKVFGRAAAVGLLAHKVARAANQSVAVGTRDRPSLRQLPCCRD